jgi:putative ABC transport system permease protein
MFKNYLISALRHIVKNRLFTVINVLGLAIGMMSCILIALFVRDEMSYDTFLPDGDRVVRLHTAYYDSADRPPFLTVRSAGRMMEALRTYAASDIEAGVRLFFNGTTILKGSDAFTETMVHADASFFDVLDLPFAQGSAETSFRNIGDFLVTEETALKYFGRTDVVGETLTNCCIGGEQLLKISGVLKDLPEASHLDFDMLFVMNPKIFEPFPNILDTWNSVNVFTYFKLRPGSTAAGLKDRVYTWLDNESVFKDNPNIDGKPSNFIKPNVMPLLDLHLNAIHDAGNLGDIKAMGDSSTVTIFIGVAILVLLIASINFMNLSTAKASQRAREVALRKVMGASRKQVAVQFLGEAVGIACFALILALVAVEIMLPLYNDVLGKQLVLDWASELPLFGGMVTAAVAVGLISGSYPAAYLSGYMPARILQSNKSNETSGTAGFRAALVVAQFAISIGLVTCTAVVYGQTMYAKSLDLGYSHQGKLALTSVGNINNSQETETLRQALEKIPGVTSVVMSSEVPSQDNQNNTGFKLIDAEGGAANQPVILNIHSIGYDFLESYDIKPIAGRGFDRDYGSDAVGNDPVAEGEVGSASLVLNESAVRMLGIASPEEAIGKMVNARVFRIGHYNFTIVGVIPDMYFRSVKFGVRASAYWLSPTSFRGATISFSTNDIPNLTTNIERVWKEQQPQTPIAYEFLSDMIAAQYDLENRQAQLFAAFSVLAIVIACLGLYGLASFMAEQRTKEIGIRKVLGATIRDIVQLLVWQFSRPVLIANLLAWPVAWYFLSGWLETFRYSIGDSYILVVALVSGLVALLIAWVTVAGRAYGVARTNPISALRHT